MTSDEVHETTGVGDATHGVTELIGVYDADSTVIGEVSYWVKARFGAAHCALCDLTHGTFRVKREWTECSRSLGIPVVTYHRNDAPTDVLSAISEFPVLLARTPGGLRVALTRSELEVFNGSTDAFIEWLRKYATS